MGILDHDLLIIDQVTSFLSNDFAIRDAAGNAVGHITTEGSTMSRMFLGSRRLTVADEGGVVVGVLDRRDFGRDRYALSDPTGRPLATVIQRITFWRPRLRVEMVGGPVIEVEGNVWERDFEAPGRARVSRSWPDLGSALLGRNRYAVGFAPGLPRRERAAIIGTVVAVDLVRAKQSRAAAASS